MLTKLFLVGTMLVILGGVVLLGYWIAEAVLRSKMSSKDNKPR